MIYRGTVRNGVVILPLDVHLEHSGGLVGDS